MLRLVINLDRSRDRLDFISKQFKALNIPFTRIAAIDGNNLDEEIISKCNSDYQNCLRKKLLSLGEIGCFLSHRACWEFLLRSNEKWAFIAEDDIVLSNNSKYFLYSDEWIPSSTKFIHASLITSPWISKVLKRTIKINNQYRLYIPIYPAIYGAQGYFISRQAATTALELSERYLPDPVDNFLFRPYNKFPKIYDIWKLNPSIAISREIVSIISTSREHTKRCNLSLKSRIYKEFIRKKTIFAKRFLDSETFDFK